MANANSHIFESTCFAQRRPFQSQFCECHVESPYPPPYPDHGAHTADPSSGEYGRAYGNGGGYGGEYGNDGSGQASYGYNPWPASGTSNYATHAPQSKSAFRSIFGHSSNNNKQQQSKKVPYPTTSYPANSRAAVPSHPNYRGYSQPADHANRPVYPGATTRPAPAPAPQAQMQSRSYAKHAQTTTYADYGNHVVYPGQQQYGYRSYGYPLHVGYTAPPPPLQVRNFRSNVVPQQEEKDKKKKKKGFRGIGTAFVEDAAAQGKKVGDFGWLKVTLV